EPGERLLPLGGEVHLVPFEPEGAPERLSHGPFVVDDENAHTNGSLRPKAEETMNSQPVELHIVSDATGETATRLVAAVEAQFPDQQFEEVRHPRVETVDDLRLVVERAKHRPAVLVYTIVKPELRAAMRDL